MKLKYDGLAPKMVRFQKLLEQFVASNIAQPRERTLLELARVSRSELAYSNLWKFFFTPNEEHRLGDSALRSLFEAAGARFDTTDFSSAEVEREVITPSGKFIDLLGTTRSLIVAVENKIDAPLYNDLADYSDYIDQRTRSSPYKGRSLPLGG